MGNVIFKDPLKYDEERFDWLSHIGTPHDGNIPHSGRHPWGSGETPYQRCLTFNQYVASLRKEGLPDTEIAKIVLGKDGSTTKLRQRISANKDMIWTHNATEALKLHDRGWSNLAISKKLGVTDVTVANYLNPVLMERHLKTAGTVTALKEAVEKKKYVDVGAGTAEFMGVSPARLGTALDLLTKQEGYTIHKFDNDQMTTKHQTHMMVLTKDDVSFGEVMKHRDEIGIVLERSLDGGKTYEGPKPPVSIDSKRIFVRYGEDGGSDKDGTIELRPGVKDLDLGEASYAQVRIAVDGKYYMKGMAYKSDEVPPGYDVIYNSNKHHGAPMDKVFKELKDDPDSPFGASILEDKDLKIVQPTYIGSDGKEHRSALNIVNEQGKWGEWSRDVSSQFLGKQRPAVAKRQLDLTLRIKQGELEDIMKMAVKNPVLGKKLLEEFADSCDSDASDLKAVGFPKQTSRVILPLVKGKENEVYARGYEDGTRLALLRFPHASIDELADVIVNNRTAEGRSIIGNHDDAIGVHPNVAKRLSGADFDGDTVVCIPNNDGKIMIGKMRQELRDFDPKEAYPGYEGMRKMTKHERGIEMGKVSNLITDMTIKGADTDQLIRAIKHSMVVIDAEKHGLDWRKSEKDYRIAELRAEFQNGGGVSTLLSKAGHEIDIPERKEGQTIIDPETGKKHRQYYDPDTGDRLYTDTGKTKYIVDKRRLAVRDENGKTVKDANGKTVYKYAPVTDEDGNVKYKEVGRNTTVTLMDRIFESGGNAMDLSSGTRIENVYAEYANAVKQLGRNARKAIFDLAPYKQDKAAAKLYEAEVKSLEDKIANAKKNAPLERMAQRVALVRWRSKLYDHPEWEGDNDRKKKERAKVIKRAREDVGAKKDIISLTEREWEAISNFAISASMLRTILDNADPQQYKSLALPRTERALSGQKVATIRSLNARGYTPLEIANTLGISQHQVQEVI